MATTKHGAGSASGKAAGDNRRDTRITARTERTAAAKPQMERKPHENGG